MREKSIISGSKAVVGVYSYVDDAVKAVRAIKETPFELKVYSPVPNHELEHLVEPQKSPVRRFTLVGGILGLISGFTLAIMCSLDYPLRVSAKDIVSVPGFVVIGYECTILFGALATLAGVFLNCRLFSGFGFDPRFSGDKFGVVVACPTPDIDHVREKLLAAGADEVAVRDAM